MNQLLLFLSHGCSEVSNGGIDYRVPAVIDRVGNLRSEKEPCAPLPYSEIKLCRVWQLSAVRRYLDGCDVEVQRDALAGSMEVFPAWHRAVRSTRNDVVPRHPARFVSLTPQPSPHTLSSLHN